MARFNASSLTDAGAALQQKIEMEGGTLTFTKVSTGNGVWTASDSLTEATDLKSPIQDFDISSVEIDEYGQTQVKAVATNEDLEEAYFMREVGLYAEDPDAGEILFSISVVYNENEADFMPVYDGKVLISVTLISYFKLSPTMNVEIQSQTGYASAYDFDELVDSIEELDDTSIEEIWEDVS